ncbi:ras-related and estrogen-regulated growth inhibitor-like [Babylonia areolata]|uniref:ras-related and estrogen-regulated growth inhibitor-like n=1 Tax=Babylonia areolata TaxID=304850 RepID=UPI003FD68326
MTAVMAAVSPSSQGRLLRRISIANRPRPFRVVVLGQEGVGKSALTVRFLTRRFIGDYDPHLEKVYTCTRCVDGDTVVFEVLDTAAPDNQSIEESIRWADAYILLYSVADRCSLNECLRLKVLINAYGKRSRKLSLASPEAALSINPVALVGNQNDRSLDRMVPLQEGVSCAAQLGCVAFYEISVRECCDSVHTIFEDLYTCHKRPKKFRAIYPRRSVSECKFPSPSPPPSTGLGEEEEVEEEAGGEGEGEDTKGKGLTQRRRRRRGKEEEEEEEAGEGDGAKGWCRQETVVVGVGGMMKEVEMAPSRRRGALQCIS